MDRVCLDVEQEYLWPVVWAEKQHQQREVWGEPGSRSKDKLTSSSKGEQQEMPAGCEAEGHGDSKSKEATVKSKAQWLRLCTPNAEGSGSISGQGPRSQVLQLRPNKFFFF